VIREHRKLGPDVWSYRWWESGPNGNRVHRRIVFPLNMHAPLKGELIIGSHPAESWNRGVQGFKIHEVDRVLRLTQFRRQLRAEPRLPSLHARSRTPLNLAQREVIGDFTYGGDSQFLQFLHRAGMQSRQVADVVIRKWRIASVIELARNGMGAMTSRLDVRRCGHRQNCECRSKLECQFRLQLHNLPCDVPNSKETPRIDAAAPENKRAVDVRQTAGTNVQPRPRNNAVLNTEVIKMLLFKRCRVIRHVGAKIEGDDYPSSQPLIDLLTETFQKEATKGMLRAAGICYDVLTVPPGKHQKQDAICCGLEHCLGEAVDVFKPYVRTEDGNFRYEEIFATKRTVQFFCQMPRG
jgi:hypothetical protein